MLAGIARLRLRFRDQFVAVPGGLAYRRGGRGPALPVNAEDRDMLVRGFDRASGRLAWGGVALAMLGLGLTQWLRPDWPRWAVVMPLLVVMSAMLWAAWNAPLRLLDGRAPLAPALPGREVRRHGLRTLPWSVLILGAGVSVALAVRVAFEPDPSFAAQWRSYVWAAATLTAFIAMGVAKRRAG